MFTDLHITHGINITMVESFPWNISAWCVIVLLISRKRNNEMSWNFHKFGFITYLFILVWKHLQTLYQCCAWALSVLILGANSPLVREGGSGHAYPFTTFFTPMIPLIFSHTYFPQIVHDYPLVQRFWRYSIVHRRWCQSANWLPHSPPVNYAFAMALGIPCAYIWS